jgi:hypothetical protein
MILLIFSWSANIWTVMLRISFPAEFVIITIVFSYLNSQSWNFSDVSSNLGRLSASMSLLSYPFVYRNKFCSHVTTRGMSGPVADLVWQNLHVNKARKYFNFIIINYYNL